VVSVSVCLSARKQLVQILLNFPYTLPVALARSCSDDNAISCVLLVMWICLPVIGDAKATLIEYIQSDSPAAAPGTKCDTDVPCACSPMVKPLGRHVQ